MAELVLQFLQLCPSTLLQFFFFGL
ncbi:hypothetical protein MCP1_5270001 [Candidatus Terasakiella magnetica]|nr:hypothetical protein MCP1_5270001 [Candidatus Terasakiella magnetica]